MSGTDPGGPLVLLPGEVMDAFIGSIGKLASADPVIIDTFPIVPRDLPGDPAQRLFVCAHRFAYESATPVTFVGASNRATVRVASVEALISMKAHALRFGRPQRRATKRASDLSDMIRLVTAGDDGPTSWQGAWWVQPCRASQISHDHL